MIRAATLVPILLGAAAPAFAATYYRAEPAAPPPHPAVVIARDNVWHCAGGGCTADRGPSRPAIACATLVREVGALASFSADGRAFGTEELAACNRRARAG